MNVSSHTNGQCWRDSEGNTLQAHGGGILLHEGAYYWYGENRDGPLRQLNGARLADNVGVSCYRSTDLLNWQHLGVVLPAVDDPHHDLHIHKVIERPKVIYNKATQRFVMWLHVDSPDYAYARAGVAVADTPAGPFRYLRSFRPNGFMSRDQTLFVDDDGRAYHIAASDDNQTTMISLLSGDYLDVSGQQFAKCFAGRFMEAFALTKHHGRYWMIASGCTGWDPNTARSAVADSLRGPWVELDNPCVGADARVTFGAQSTFIIPPGPANREHIAMFDLWRPEDLRTSGYLWLPIRWEAGRMRMEFHPTPEPARAGPARAAIVKSGPLGNASQ